MVTAWVRSRTSPSCSASSGGTTRCMAPVSTRASVSRVCTWAVSRWPSCARTSSRVLCRVTGMCNCPTTYLLRHRSGFAGPRALHWGCRLLRGPRHGRVPQNVDLSVHTLLLTARALLLTPLLHHALEHFALLWRQLLQALVDRLLLLRRYRHHAGHHAQHACLFFIARRD